MANNKMLEIIIRILNVKGFETLDAICNKYAIESGEIVTFGKRLAIKSTLEYFSSDTSKYGGNDDLFCYLGENLWALRAYSDSSGKKIYKKDKRTRTPAQKLNRRIKREIKRVKYLGDIIINDEEYNILINHLKSNVQNYSTLANKKDDAMFAVALVQIGIRFYNGRYWPHVSKELNIKIDGNRQRIIGEAFYKVLLHYDKFVGEPSEIVNNILMHCFITNYYSKDFFDFLFMYYQKDLNRDLEQHTREMRDYLMSSMKKADMSARAYKIKKGTADAVTANEFGCKIRVRNILKWMDEYLFNDALPEKSENRVAKLFVQWAKNSSAFDLEKHGAVSKGKRGKTIFKYPKLDFDPKTGQFQILLPIQTIPLSDDEDWADISWKVDYAGNSETINSEVESSVIGCKTVDIEKVVIDPDLIFSSFKIELIKNGTETVKKFPISRDSVRFFDEDFCFVADNRLSNGTVYAFTNRDESIETNSYYDKESFGTLDLYNLYLENGDVIKKPDGKAVIVGDDLKEGLIENSYCSPMAIVTDERYDYSLFSKVPSVLFKTKAKAEKGTIISINGRKEKFDPNSCIEFRQDDSDLNCYLLNLSEYCKSNGIYRVIIDIPNDRKNREYQFAFIKDFEMSFDKTSYVFEKDGIITLPMGFSCDERCIEKVSDTDFRFSISPELESIQFTSPEGLSVIIDTPVLRWKFNEDDEWSVEEPEELWHKELPENIYFSYPSSYVSIYSSYIDMDSENESAITSKINPETNIITVETRKIKSWLDMSPVLLNLYIEGAGMNKKFLSVVTKSYLLSCRLSNDVKNKDLIIDSTILGFADCVVDVYCDGAKVVEKYPLKYNGARIKTDKLYGNFELTFFEADDDDDDEFDFGVEVYSDFARKSFEILNENELANYTIKVDYISEDKPSNSIFKASRYNISDFIIKNIEWDADEETYVGVSASKNPVLDDLKVSIELIECKDNDRALLSFYSDEEECFIDILYDRVTNKLVLEEDEALSSSEANRRYIICYGDYYYHIERKKIGE